MVKDNDCYGCHTIVRCKFYRENYRSGCPCQQCIVKAMCKTVCDNYLLFNKEVRRKKYGH